MYQSEHQGELTWRAVILGLALAIMFGAANAYLGLKAGMTIAATFPAAVIAIAAFRLPFMRGTVLEQNIARTTAAVGEALVAAAIFTLPAFMLAHVDGEPLWDHFHYFESVAILAAGGVLGLLFIALLRRGLTVDAGLPFPESVACFDIVRAGQGHDGGARFVMLASILGATLEFFKNAAGVPIYKESTEFSLPVAPDVLVSLQTPTVSPALLSVGYIIGPRFAGLTALGSVIAWLVIVPALVYFESPEHIHELTSSGVAYHFWEHHLRPIAIGTMFVASIFTLWGLREPIANAVRGVLHTPAPTSASTHRDRREHDLSPRTCVVAAILITIPLVAWYWLSHSVLMTALMSVVIFAMTFLLSIIGAWLVGLVGSSNQPVSGVTITAIIMSGLLLAGFGIGGRFGVTAVLVIAVIICSAAALSGTLIQELKVGQLLGATPWKMQVAQLIGTVIVAFICVTPMVILHESAVAQAVAQGLPPIGIGGPQLSAPQASLMAQVTTAILGGTIAWDMVGIGAAFGIVLVLLGVRGPMVIAVGMYLPLETTFAILLGGLCKWLLDRRSLSLPPNDRAGAANRGTLIASGLIAGEAIAGVCLAGAVLIMIRMADGAQVADSWSLSNWLPSAIDTWAHTWGDFVALPVLALLIYCLVWVPLKSLSRS